MATQTDRVRGKGGTARDRGTLWLNIIVIAVAIVAAGILTGAFRNATAWQFGSTGLSVAGLVVMWAGLAILLVLPAGVLIHRIFVEETALTESIASSPTGRFGDGRPYRASAGRT